MLAMVIGCCTLAWWQAEAGIGGARQSSASAATLAVHDVPLVIDVARARAGMLAALAAERSLLCLAHESEYARKQQARHAAAAAEAGAAIERICAAATDPEVVASAHAVRAAFGEWLGTSREVLAILAEDMPRARRDAVDTSMGASAAACDRLLLVMEGAFSELAEAAKETAGATASAVADLEGGMRARLYAGISIAVLAGLLAVSYVARCLGRVTAGLRAIAAGHGDLTIRLPERETGELGRLVAAFNRFLDGQQELVRGIREAEDRLVAAARTIEGLSQAMTEQARTIDLRLAAVGEAASSMRDRASAVAIDTASLDAAFELLGTQASEGSVVADRSQQQVLDACGRVDSVGRDTARVRGLVRDIEAIARQVNLLSLNAAVEAVRAGESGLGFVVVADRVKELAGRATKVSEAIAVSMDGFLARVTETSRSIAGLEPAMDQLRGGSDGMASAVAEQTGVSRRLTQAAEVMATAAQDIDRELQTMQDVATEARSSATSSQSAAQEVVAAAQELRQRVGRLRV